MWMLIAAHRCPSGPLLSDHLDSRMTGPSTAYCRSRKCGRPRVYDTVTPVLAAAEVAAAGVPPPVRRCRGAKPKYVCHTEQEAVAKRCVFLHDQLDCMHAGGSVFVVC